MYKLSNPILSFLNETQLNAYNKYSLLYENFEEKIISSKEGKNIALSCLNDFYFSLEQHMQSSLKEWYTLQLCDIDPLIAPCGRMSEYLIENNMKNAFAISNDGQDFLLLFEDKQNLTTSISQLQQRYSQLKYEVIEVKN